MQCIQVNPPTQNVCKSICCSFPIKFSIKECVGSSISFELLVHREKKVGVEAKPRTPMHTSICVSICMPVHLSRYLYSFIHIFLSKREALYTVSNLLLLPHLTTNWTFVAFEPVANFNRASEQRAIDSGILM